MVWKWCDRHAKTASHRVLFATGYADLGAYRDGLEGEDMFRKPYRMADLAARGDRALGATGNGRLFGGAAFRGSQISHA